MALETERKVLDRERLTRGVMAVLDDATKGFYLVAEDASGEVIGQLMVTFEWSDWRDGVFWWIQSVYVVPEARRTGVYRALYERVLRLAADDGGVCGVRLYVERENEPAMSTYRALGMARAHYEMFELDLMRS
jgi:GNAT superfamily N-acetyltransferase